MRVIVAFWLLLFVLVSLAPDMQGAQYLKVGSMLDHFQKDYQSKGISFESFLDFLHEHYSKSLDLSKDEHRQLPFKTNASSSIHLTINEVNIKPQIAPDVNYFYPNKVYFSEPNFEDGDRLFSIWNPPRA